MKQILVVSPAVALIGGTLSVGIQTFGTSQLTNDEGQFYRVHLDK